MRLATLLVAVCLTIPTTIASGTDLEPTGPGEAAVLTECAVTVVGANVCNFLCQPGREVVAIGVGTAIVVTASCGGAVDVCVHSVFTQACNFSGPSTVSDLPQGTCLGVGLGGMVCYSPTDD